LSSLKIEHLAKSFNNTPVMHDLNLDVAEGDMVALLGPSGCGKSTTLRIVAGFESATSGRILLNGQDITTLPAHKRNTGMVFQSYALFPHMSVASNVGFGLEMRKIGRAVREDKVRAALDMVQLSHLADRMPGQLSGGQQQRVALARALAINPALLLLDEPLSNLDAKLRGEVQHEIRALQQRLGLTTLIVTHDQEEALTMSDKMVVMEGGRIRQAGAPRELYDAPDNVFVARFVGNCNLVEGRREGHGIFRAKAGALLPFDSLSVASGDTVLALRPERIHLSPALDGAASARVISATYLGAQTEIRIDLDGAKLRVMMPTPARQDPLADIAPGMLVNATWAPEDARLLPAS
jgi:putative spermidine/putrescine transport system ATP-binding protein